MAAWNKPFDFSNGIYPKKPKYIQGIQNSYSTSPYGSKCLRMDKISPPPNASPAEIEAWNQMMDTMVTFIKASTNLMNTITSKVRIPGYGAAVTKPPKGCEPECEVCLPKPPPPACGVCTEDEPPPAKKSSKTTPAKKPSKAKKSTSVLRSGSLSSDSGTYCSAECSGVITEDPEAEAAPKKSAEKQARAAEGVEPEAQAEEEEPVADAPEEAEAAEVKEGEEEDGKPEEAEPAEVAEAEEEAPATEKEPSKAKVDEEKGEVGDGGDKNEAKPSGEDKKEPAAGDTDKCCCGAIREEREKKTKSRCCCKKKKKKHQSSAAAIPEEDEEGADEVEEVERKCGCGASPGNKQWLMQEMIVKLENAQSEITQLQEELARLQRMDMSKKLGPHATPNPAKLYQEIMRGSQQSQQASGQRMYQQMAPQGQYPGYSDSNNYARANQPTRVPSQPVNQSASRLPNQSANRLPTQPANQSANRLPSQSANQSANRLPSQSANQLSNQSGNLLDCDPGCAGLSEKEESSDSSLECNPGCDGQSGKKTPTGYGTSTGQSQMRMASYQAVSPQNMGAPQPQPYYSNIQQARRTLWNDPSSGYNNNTRCSQGQQQYYKAAAAQGYPPANMGPAGYYPPQYAVPAQPSVTREAVLCPTRAPCQDKSPPPKRMVVCSQQQPQNLSYDNCSPDCPGSF